MVFTPFARVKSGGINEDELGILLRRDGEFGFIDGGDAVTDRNPLPVDKDHALSGGDIGVSEASRRVSEGGSGKKRGAQDPRVGADQNGISTLRISARQLDKASGAIRLGEFSAVPARLPAAVVRQQPDLEELEKVFVAIVFGMTDSRSSAHDLDVAGHGPADIAGAVFVRHGAVAHIGDDFHVGMGVTAEAGAGRDLVVVPDHEGAEGAIRGIAFGRNDEVMARLQPAEIAVIERFLGSKLQHDHYSTTDAIVVRFGNGYGAEPIA